MRLFLVHNPALVSPLEAPARDAWLLDSTLGRFMEREFDRLGLTIERVSTVTEAEERCRKEADGAFVTFDSTVCSRLLVERFVRAARRRRGPACLVCALPRGNAIDEMALLDGLEEDVHPSSGEPTWRAPLYFLRGAGSLASPEPVVLPYEEDPFIIKMPVGYTGKPEEAHWLTESYACNVCHWLHVHRLNMAAMTSWWWNRLRSGYWIGGLAWAAWRVLSGFPWTGGRLLEGIRSVSLRASIHRSTCLQLAVVKKGASIGPFCFLQNAYVGEGATIESGATVINSVIADGAFVGRDCAICSSVVYPRAFAGQFLMQASLLGEDACAFTNSGFFDLNLKKNARVLHRGKYVDAGSQFVGVCMGPRSRVAAGVWVASGREIPQGALLVKDPADTASDMERVAPDGPSIIRNGAVIPLGK